MPSSTNTSGTTPGGGSSQTGSTANKFSWDQPPGTTNNFTPTSLQNTIGYDITTGLNQGPKVNTNPGYAGIGSTTTGALNSMLGASDNPTYNQDAQGALASIGGRAAGNGLNYQDPYFKANLAHTLNDAATGVNATYGANGRFGSNVAADQLGSTLGNISNAAYTQNYQDSINQQQSAAGMLPGLYDNTLKPSQTALGVGAVQDTNAQSMLTDQNRITDLKNNAPLKQLQDYLGLLNSGNPNSSTGSLAQTTTPNPILQGLGYAGSLASLLL